MASALTSALIPVTSPNPVDPPDDDMDLFDSIFGSPTQAIEGPRIPTWMAPKSGYQFHEFKPEAWNDNPEVVKQQAADLENYIAQRGGGRSPSIVANEWLQLKRKQDTQKSPFQQRMKDKFGVDVADDPEGFRNFMSATPGADPASGAFEWSKLNPAPVMPDSPLTHFIDQAFQSHVSDEVRGQVGRSSGRGLHNEYDSALMHILNRTSFGDPNLLNTAYVHAHEVSKIKPGDDPNAYRGPLQAMNTHAEMAALGETDMQEYLKRKKINEYYASPAGRKEAVAQRTTWEFVKNHLAELRTEAGKGNRIAAATLNLIEGASNQGKQYSVNGIDDAEAAFDRFKSSPVGKYLTGVTLSQLNGQGIFTLPEAKDAMKQVANGFLSPDDAKMLGSKIRLGTTLADMLSPKGIKTPEDVSQWEASARLYGNQLENGSTPEDAAKPLGRFTNADFLHAITGYTADAPNNVGLFAQHERSPIFTPLTTLGSFPVASNTSASMNVQGWGTAKNQPQFLGNLVANLDMSQEQRNKLADLMGFTGDRRDQFLIGIQNPSPDYQGTLQTLADKVSSETVALTGAQQSNRVTSTISNVTQKLMDALGQIGLDKNDVQDLRATLWDPIAGARLQLQGNAETGPRRLVSDLYHSFAQTTDGTPILLQPTKNITGTDAFRMQMSDLFTGAASDSKLRAELNKNMSSVLNDNNNTGSVLFDGDQGMFAHRLEKSLRWLHRTAQQHPDLAADIEKNLGITSLLGQSEDGFTKDVLRSLKSNDTGEIGGVLTKFNYLGSILKDNTLERTVLPGPDVKGPRDLSSPVERAVLGSIEGDENKRRRATSHLGTVQNNVERGITDGLERLTLLADPTTDDITAIKNDTRKKVLSGAISSLTSNQIFRADDGRGLDKTAEQLVTKYIDSMIAAMWTGGGPDTPNVEAARQALYKYIDSKNISVTSSSPEARRIAYENYVAKNQYVGLDSLTARVQHLLQVGTPYGARNQAIIDGLQQKIGLLELSKEGNDDPEALKSIDNAIKAYQSAFDRMVDPNVSFASGGPMTADDYAKRGLPGVRNFGAKTSTGAPFGTLVPWTQYTDEEKMAEAEDAAARWMEGERVLPWEKVDKNLKYGRTQTILRYPSSFEGTELFDLEGWNEKRGGIYTEQGGEKQSLIYKNSIDFKLKNGAPNPNVVISRRVIKPTDKNPYYKVVYEATQYSGTGNGRQIVAKAKLIPNDGRGSVESKAYDDVASAKADVDAILDQVKNLPQVAELRAKLDGVTERLSTTWNEYADASDRWNAMSVAEQQNNPQAKDRLDKAKDALKNVDNDISIEDFAKLQEYAPNRFPAVVAAIRKLNEAEQKIRTFSDPKHRSIDNFTIGELAKFYERRSGGASTFDPATRDKAEQMRAGMLIKGPKLKEGEVLPGRTAAAQRRIDTREWQVSGDPKLGIGRSPAIDFGFEPTNDLFYDIGHGFHLWDPSLPKQAKVQPQDKTRLDFTSPGRQGGTDNDAEGDPGRLGVLGPVPPEPKQPKVEIIPGPRRTALRSSTAYSWMQQQPMYQQGTPQQRRLLDDVARSLTFKLPTELVLQKTADMTPAQKRMYAAELQVQNLRDLEIARRKRIAANKDVKPDSLIHNSRYVGLTVSGDHYWLDTDKYLELVKKISSGTINDYSQIWEHGGDNLIIKHIPPRGKTKSPTEMVKIGDVPGAKENVTEINKKRGGGNGATRNIVMAFFTLGFNRILDTFREGFAQTQAQPRKK